MNKICRNKKEIVKKIMSYSYRGDLQSGVVEIGQPNVTCHNGTNSMAYETQRFNAAFTRALK